ncbi:MAG TPA: M20/M25/M40 family metallo-hydrolase [Bryobacteraceae bacterium]|nr:M20/M25/M40 family metallo-hydrolase [Bryobacteraceae bacterium]
MRRLPVVLAVGVSCLLFAQEKVDEATDARMRSEEMEHSQLMHTLHMLTDRYGPRVTGTPNHEAAARWVVAETTRWGFKNAHLEPWEFGHPGWLNERATGYIVEPVRQNLKFEVLAWTPSTNGTVTASAVQLELPRGPQIPPPTDAADGSGGRGAAFLGGRGGRGGPQYQQATREQLENWMAANRERVRGRVVMIGKAAVIPVNFAIQEKRIPDDRVAAMYDPNNPNGGRGRGNFGGRGRGASEPGRMTAQEVSDALDGWLVVNGALLRMDDAARGEGIIVAQQHRAYDPSKTIPTVILRNDDYGRIERLLADREDVKVEFNIVNQIYPEGKTSYNVVAEIPGADKADEVVMLGGHLDSWHAATGATDNAAGSSIMLEAARLIQVLGLKPRRTIRVALWSGEEEGLLGSLAYVKQHFGTFENQKPEFSKLDCYFNVDSGTGRIRGGSIFGPPEAAAVLRPVLMQFKEWGVGGINVTGSRNTGGTDSTSFNNAGLPGVGLQQDPIEYMAMTHHTNLDTYERMIPEDVKEAAVVVASAVWHVANRDAMVPRFTKEQMPAPVEPR